MRQKILPLSFILLIALVIAACSGDESTNNPPPSPSPMPAANTVMIQDDFFSPANMTVSAGSTVTWNWQGNHQHTVTNGEPADDSAGSLFDNGPKSTGSFQFTFNQKGTFKYFCRVHGAAMTGTITVN